MTQDKDSVKVKTNFKWFLGIVAVLILLAVGYGAFKPSSIPEGYLSEEDAKLAIADAVTTGVASAVESKDTEIADLNQQIADLQVAEEEEISLLGYLVDGLFLETAFGDVYSDRELNLFDGEVEFDDVDYDAEATFTIFDNMLIKSNENDFLGNPYLVVPEGAIEYKFVIESGLDTILIGNEDKGYEDETLKFNLLGKEVEVSNWDDDGITFTQGNEYYLSAGESVEVDGKTILLDMVFDGAVYVKVGEEGEKIKEGETAKVGGIEIKVDEVLYSGYSGGYAKAELVIGEDVEITVESGEEYEEDSIWEWSIDANSIGLVLVEEFVELDEDEDYNALAVGEKVCLPNDYVCVVFNGLAEEDVEEYAFELDGDFVEVEGNFQSGLEDYDRVYISKDGLIYEDDNTDDLIGEEVKLGDSDLVMSASEQWNRILIQDSVSENKLVFIDLNLIQIQVDKIGDIWKDISSKDENFLTNYGILIENPKDSVEDKEFNLAVPMEQLEGSISLQ